MIEAIRSALTGLKVMPDNEKRLQEWIAERLTACGISFKREVRCGKGLVDFVVGRMAVEVKTAGSELMVVRQLLGYLEDRRFTCGLIISTKPMRAIGNLTKLKKPIHKIELWSQFL